MQRKVLSNLYFLLATLLIFVAGCGKKAPPSTIIGKDGAEMILIPAGEFIMGSPEGKGTPTAYSVS